MLGTDEAGEQKEGESEQAQEKRTEELLDLPPANSKLKFVDVPRVATSAELPSILSRVKLEQCPECFCLSDECTSCEESSARQLIAAYTGAADPSGGLDLPECSTYTKPTSSSPEKHSLSELSDLIQKVETFQADGFVAKVRDRFKHASRALKGAILFCVDSGASDHICCQEDAFETLNKNAPSKLFKVVHGTARIRSEGVGTVLIPVVLPDGKVVRIRLYNVYYIPSQPFNLISVPRCLEQGWEDPRFSRCEWTYKGIKVPLTKHGNYFIETFVDSAREVFSRGQNYLNPTALKASSVKEGAHQESFAKAKGPINPSKQSNLEIKNQTAEARYRQNIANRPYREKADWQFSKTEYQKWATELGDSKGGFHVDLFTDGKGPVAGNAQESVFHSAQDDAFKHYWGGKFCWGNPVFEAEFIRRMLEKAEEDFQSDPENTRFCFIVPYYRTASWWALTAPYEIKHVYSKDALIYSAPRSQCYSPDKLKDAGEQGGEDRVFIQGAGFESVVLYTDKFSPIRVDPYALAHLRLGHYSAECIQRLLELGVDLGLPLSITVLSKSKLSC